MVFIGNWCRVSETAKIVQTTALDNHGRVMKISTWDSTHNEALKCEHFSPHS